MIPPALEGDVLKSGACLFIKYMKQPDAPETW
jgi:hypothetical protein